MIDDSGRTICSFPLIFIYIVPRRIWLHICFSLKKSQITKCIAIQSFKGFNKKINEKSRWTIFMIDDSGRTICSFPLIFIYIVPRRIWLHICFSLKKSQITKCIAIQSFKGFKLNYGKIKMLQSNKDLLSQLG